MRWRLGEAGIDRRGLWIDDPAAGARFRLGLVGLDLAGDFYSRGQRRLAEEALSKPRLGVFVERRF